MYSYSQSSESKLATCDDKLQLLARELIKHRDVTIQYGHRDQETQNSLHAAGRSQLKWPKSRHNSLPAEAVDMVPYPVPQWSLTPSNDGERLRARDFWIGWGNYVKGVADAIGVDVTWGGDWDNDWESFDHRLFDAAHFELRKV